MKATKGQLKVFSGTANRKGSATQVQMLVAATSVAKAVAALQAHGVRMTTSYLNGYWSKTNGNPTCVALATSQPGRVFATSGRHASDYALLPLQEKTDDNESSD